MSSRQEPESTLSFALFVRKESEEPQKIDQLERSTRGTMPTYSESQFSIAPHIGSHKNGGIPFVGDSFVLTQEP